MIVRRKVNLKDDKLKIHDCDFSTNFDDLDLKVKGIELLRVHRVFVLSFWLRRFLVVIFVLTLITGVFYGSEFHYGLMAARVACLLVIFSIVDYFNRDATEYQKWLKQQT